MKQILRKTLLLIGVFLGGISSAWADGEIPFVAGNTIGDATNPTGGWYYAKSEIFEIPANKTLTLKFKTYSATDAQLTAASAGVWGAYMTHAINLWGGEANLFWRGDGYGWKTTEPEKNTSTSDWYTFLGGNTRWGTDGAELREDITGSDVIMTIARVGGELRMIQDFTATSGKYRRYFVLNYGTADGSIWAQLTVDHAYVTVSENYSITDTSDPTITGSQIGLTNNTTAFWTAWSDYFTLEPDQSLTLRYKCYSNRINSWNGGVPYVTTDADRGATGYTEYFGLRPDNWVNVAGVNATSTNYDAISWNWATFREKVDGSTVTVTITRSGANVAIREEFAPADASTTLWEEYNQDCGDGTQNIRVFLTVEGGHLDLLSTSQEVYNKIGATEWGTYVSEYPLDFTGYTDVKAYKVTGRTSTAIVTEQLTGIVPANTPMLLNAQNGAVLYTIPVAASAGSSVGDNCLKAGTGAAVSKDGSYDRYVLVNDGGAKFKKILSNPATVATNRAYLQFSAGSGSRDILSIDGGDATGINMVNGEGLKINGSEVYYNLQGQRVLYPTKGLYVVNGKKVIIK